MPSPKISERRGLKRKSAQPTVSHDSSPTITIRRMCRSADNGVIPYFLINMKSPHVEENRASTSYDAPTTPRARRSLYRALQANAEDPILLQENERFLGSIPFSQRSPVPDRLNCNYNGRDIIDNGTAEWSPVSSRHRMLPRTPPPHAIGEGAVTPVNTQSPRTPWAPVVVDSRIPLRGVGVDTMWTPRPRQRNRVGKVRKNIRFDDVQ